MLQAQLVVEQLALEAQVLKGLVGRDESQAAGNLVALAALDAHKTVLNLVEATVAVAAGDGVELDDDILDAHLLAVE